MQHSHCCAVPKHGMQHALPQHVPRAYVNLQILSLWHAVLCLISRRVQRLQQVRLETEDSLYRRGIYSRSIERVFSFVPTEGVFRLLPIEGVFCTVTKNAGSPSVCSFQA